MYEILFWAGAAVPLYTYVVYPLAVAVAGRIMPREHIRAPVQASASIILAVFNEEGHLRRRLEELTRHIQISHIPAELIVVSDGSTDTSEDIAREFQNQRVRLLAHGHNRGKAVALSTGVAHARGQLLIFADARQRWADDALDPADGKLRGLISRRSKRRSDPWSGSVRRCRVDGSPRERSGGSSTIT